MFSVILLVSPVSRDRPHPFAPLLRTLACLVPATVEGVVRDVVLLHVGANTDVASIANEAGCALVEAADFATALRQGLMVVRASLLMVLRAGAIPSRGFGEEAAAALDRPDGALRCWMMREDRGILGRLVPAWAPVAGVILPKSKLETSPCNAFDDVVRHARPRGNLPTAVPVLGR